jgi:hypothetical protein
MGDSNKHDLLREGILAGAIGAVVVAGWFLVTDVLQGRPLSTPSVLGQVVLYGITDPGGQSAGDRPDHRLHAPAFRGLRDLRRDRGDSWCTRR